MAVMEECGPCVARASILKREELHLDFLRKLLIFQCWLTFLKNTVWAKQSSSDGLIEFRASSLGPSLGGADESMQDRVLSIHSPLEALWPLGYLVLMSPWMGQGGMGQGLGKGLSYKEGQEALDLVVPGTPHQAAQDPQGACEAPI